MSQSLGVVEPVMPDHIKHYRERKRFKSWALLLCFCPQEDKTIIIFQDGIWEGENSPLLPRPVLVKQESVFKRPSILCRLPRPAPLPLLLLMRLLLAGSGHITWPDRSSDLHIGLEMRQLCETAKFEHVI